MALAFTGAGVATAASGASPQAVTTATAFAVGDILIALIAYDNSGGGGADPMSGTISVTPASGSLGASVSAQTGLNDPSTASSGLAVRCVAFPVTGAIASSTSCNVAWSGTIVVRAVAFGKVARTGNTSYRTNSGATGVSTAGATTPTPLVTPSVTNTELVLCWAGHENGAAITGDADTTNGSWSAVYGTFQGSGLTGMAAYFQAKVVTGTATQTWNPTGTSSDWIVGCLIFTDAAPNVTATVNSSWGSMTATAVGTIVMGGTPQFFATVGQATSGIHRGDNTTKLNGSASGWFSFALVSAESASTTTDSTSSVAGPTNGIESTSVAGTTEFISLPINQDVTIAGAITVNLWGFESDALANAAINVVIERLDSTGAIASTIVKTTRTTELTVLAVSPTLNNFTATPTSTNMLKGDRFRVRVFYDDAAAGNMASGFAMGFAYGNSVANTAQSYVQFTEVFGFQTTEPTGTVLYPTTTTGPAVGADDEREMWTSRGGSATTAVRNTATGWTAPLQWTASAGGSNIEWYSKRLTAFTLDGLVRVNLRAHESNASATAGIRAELAICNSDGSSAVVWAAATLVDSTSPGVYGPSATTSEGELNTAESAVKGWLSGDTTSVTDGQRLRLRLFVDDSASGAMATGFTATLTYNGPTGGASGDTWIQLPQSVTEFAGVTDVPGTVNSSWGATTFTAIATRETAATINSAWGVTTHTAIGSVTRVALTLVAFQFYEDDAVPTTSTPIGPQSTAIAIADTNKTMVLRVLVQNTDSRSFPVDEALWLQISVNGAAYTILTFNGIVNWGDSAFYASGGVALTASRLSGGTGSFVNGSITEIDHAVFLPVALTAGNYSEYAWAIDYDASIGAVGNTIDFRIVRGLVFNAVDTNNFTYAVTPRLLIATIVSATVNSSWGGLTATADGTVSTSATEVFGTINSAWGALVATAIAIPDHPATITTGWGSLTATAIATPEHVATVSSSWGALTATALATADHPATVSTSWGALTATAIGTASTPSSEVFGTISSNWGATVATAVATVTVPATVASSWGACTATAVALVEHTASVSTTWAMTATAIATRNTAATVSSAWGGWTATAVTAPDHVATIASSWGALTATAVASVEHTAVINSGWGSMIATSLATPYVPATGPADWGGWTATAVAQAIQRNATINSGWGAMSATAVATRETAATVSSAWGGWTASALGTQLGQVSGLVSSNWGSISATAVAKVEHSGSIVTTWVMTATAVATPEHTATINSSWGAGTFTAVAAPLEHPATITSGWGALSATAVASVAHSATVASSWGTWTATALGSSLGQQSGTISTSWGSTTFTAAATRETAASISTTWGPSNYSAIGVVTKTASINSGWGAVSFTAIGSVYTPIEIAGSVDTTWPGWFATAVGIKTALGVIGQWNGQQFVEWQWGDQVIEEWQMT